MRKKYFNGDDYNDQPDLEHNCAYSPDRGLLLNASDQYVYPCYVYDKHGKLLRVEYPKLKGGKKWTSRY